MSELLKINVNDHVEKKNGLSYLSWAWAWAEVLKIDPQATWTPLSSLEGGVPWFLFPDGSAMVAVEVKIKGHLKQCWLPVMDHRNKAIKNPDAFAVNTAIMRCMTKAIAMHGLGLYIYAGEDLPETDEPKERFSEKQPNFPGAVAGVLQEAELPAEEIEYLDDLAETLKTQFKQNGVTELVKRLALENLENIHKLYLWNKLPSDVRSAIKKSTNQVAEIA